MVMQLLGEAADTLAPSLFVVPRAMALDSAGFARRLAAASPERRAWLTGLRQHPLGVRTLGATRLRVPAAGVTAGTRLVTTAGIVRVERAEAPLLELSFGPTPQGRTHDLRPVLPLVLRH
jgi:hypothetical protein